MRFPKVRRHGTESARPPQSDGLDVRIRRLERFASSFAASEPIAPSPGRVADFADPERIAKVLAYWAPTLAAADVLPAMARDDAPLPATQNREGYNGDNHLAYWLVGYLEYLRLAELAARHGVAGGAYLDFGGSTGRVFRHFGLQSDAWRVWSCDFKATSVEWNQRHLPAGFAVFQNAAFPALPLEDRSFALITAMSVFTHIDETETTWLVELRRILRPGGLAIVTIHDETTWTRMHPSLREVIERFSPELAAHPELPPGRSVSNFRDDDPYRCNVFHSSDYIRQQWGRYFEVVEIVPMLSDVQTGVVLRRPA